MWMKDKKQIDRNTDQTIPLITIGIASYNYAHYITRGLDAIKRQKFSDYEILISDDCSTDNSVDIIKNYINNHPQMNIRLLENKQNMGICENKNRIIQNCKGKYLMLCDADDWMADDCLEKISQVIQRDNPDRVLVEVAHINEKGNIIQIEHIPKEQTKWGWILHHGCVNKVSIIKDNNITIEDYPDDLHFVLEFSKYCKKISIVNEVLYFWLVHLNSAGRKKDINITKNTIEKYAKWLRYIEATIIYIEKRNDENASKDKEELRLTLLKYYYMIIFSRFQFYDIKTMLNSYKILKNVMVDIDDRYLSNKYLCVFAPQILRKFAIKIIKLGVILERLHLMPIALIAYHVIAKFKYFDA